METSVFPVFASAFFYMIVCPDYSFISSLKEIDFHVACTNLFHCAVQIAITPISPCPQQWLQSNVPISHTLSDDTTASFTHTFLWLKKLQVYGEKNATHCLRNLQYAVFGKIASDPKDHKEKTIVRSVFSYQLLAKIWPQRFSAKKKHNM